MEPTLLAAAQKHADKCRPRLAGTLPTWCARIMVPTAFAWDDGKSFRQLKVACKAMRCICSDHLYHQFLALSELAPKDWEEDFALLEVKLQEC